MIKLNIAATRSTPAIRLDSETGQIGIAGESYPENAAAFYQPVLRDIETWLETATPGRLDVCFELLYYNSSSSKAIMNLMDLLEAAAGKGCSITVHWRFHEENDIIRESGEEFQEDYETLHIELEAFTTD